MLRLYLLTRPNLPSILINCPDDRLQAVMETLGEGARAYPMGFPDPAIPPGAVGEFSEVYPIAMFNIQKAYPKP